MRGITSDSRTEPIIVDSNLAKQRYCDEIFALVFAPFLNVNRRVTRFQQDNTRCHNVRIITEFLEQENIEKLPWPALSSNLSTMVHLWDDLDSHERLRQPATLHQLRDFLRQELTNIDQQETRTLIRSMRWRSIAVRGANGGHTRHWRLCEHSTIPLKLCH